MVVILGLVVAIVAVEPHPAATDLHLRELIEMQRAAERDAPDYVAGKLRVAQLELVTAEQHLTGTRLALATAQQTAATTAQIAGTSTPRWWHLDPLRTRIVAQHTTATAMALRAADNLDRLDEALGNARDRVAETRSAVRPLTRTPESLVNDALNRTRDARSGTRAFC